MTFDTVFYLIHIYWDYCWVTLTFDKIEIQTFNHFDFLILIQINMFYKTPG